jgi:antitoxin YefM
VERFFLLYQFWYTRLMDAINASEARRTLFQLLEQVNTDADTVEIQYKKGNAVLLSSDEYAAMQETTHLLNSPTNAARLLASLQDARSGNTQQHLLDTGDDQAA